MNATESIAAGLALFTDSFNLVSAMGAAYYLKTKIHPNKLASWIKILRATKFSQSKAFVSD